MKKNFPIGTLALFFVFLAIIGVIIAVTPIFGPKTPTESNGIMRADRKPLLPFTLSDQAGEPFTLAELGDRWTFLFFGYTSCPDICPTTLSLMSSLNDQLQNDLVASVPLQMVFVTVDPHRDTPELLREYLSYFMKNLIGVTGEVETIRQFANQFGAAFFKQEPSASGGYLMSHVSSIFLINPQAEFVASFSPPHHQQSIASRFETIRNIAEIQ